MPEFFLELFSEEIPARMQAQGAADLARLLAEALATLSPRNVRTWHGPRRIAYAADIAASVPGTTMTERGPRLSAPDAALAGFLRKHAATKDDLRTEGEFHVLHRDLPARPASAAIADALPPLLWKFPWPKSMRWAESAFTWVRPLRRIVAILDSKVVDFELSSPSPAGGEGRGEGQDKAHGLVASNLTEGHRFHAPGAFAVESAADWAEKLHARHVIAAAADRARLIHDGLTALVAAKGLALVEDPGLLDEVAGLTEWPVPLLGPIDSAYMDLPSEVMQVSMRVNQRYFALRNPDGTTAPWFGFAANIDAPDAGAAIIAGNARVLRARFADARHFWDLDRTTRLEDRVDALKGVTFHAKLGTQYDRAKRLEAIARALAPFTGADPDTAARAALLAKADLTTGMVGEFPELQGVMGGYYTRHDGEPAAIADAVAGHYLPRGTEPPPSAPVTVAVGLADRINTVFQFFAIGEKPTGSGDPYALRRAALGIIRLIADNGVRLPLDQLVMIAQAAAAHPSPQPSPTRGEGEDFPPSFVGGAASGTADEIVAFLLERLRIQMRGEGARHDVLAAVLSANAAPDIIALLNRTKAVAAMLSNTEGMNLLSAYRRASNILKIEDKKDGPHAGHPDRAIATVDQERAVIDSLARAGSPIQISLDLQDENYGKVIRELSSLRGPVDAFFDNVTVNAAEPALRLNRLRILASVKALMDQVADFSKIVE